MQIMCVILSCNRAILNIDVMKLYGSKISFTETLGKLSEQTVLISGKKFVSKIKNCEKLRSRKSPFLV